MFRNRLNGGQPGSGKTFVLRLKVPAAYLDPRCEIWGYEREGVGDFAALAAVLTACTPGRWIYNRLFRRHREGTR